MTACVSERFFCAKEPHEETKKDPLFNGTFIKSNKNGSAAILAAMSEANKLRHKLNHQEN